MIIVDLDNVLCDTIQAWIRYCNSREGKNYTTEDLHKFDTVMKIYQDSISFFKHSGYKDIKLFDGAKEFLKALKKFDNIMILSKAWRGNTEDKEKFMKENLKGYDYAIVEDKIPYMYNNNDIIIDDNFNTVYRATKEDRYGILFNRDNEYSWADIIYSDRKFAIATNYDEVIDIVRKIKK